MEEFNQKGFPIIKLHDDCFEIKAIDYWEFRTFKYSEILKIEYFHINEKYWYLNIFRVFSYSRFEPSKLKVYKQNGADWTYNSPTEFNKEFNAFIKKIRTRCGIDDSF
jgi:hypothetical protein